MPHSYGMAIWPPSPPVPPAPPFSPAAVYTITTTGGSWEREVSWTLICEGEEVISQSARDAAWHATYLVSLSVGMQCTLLMCDSYGDGWNGASWTGLGQVALTLECPYTYDGFPLTYDGFPFTYDTYGDLGLPRPSPEPSPGDGACPAVRGGHCYQRIEHFEVALVAPPPPAPSSPPLYAITTTVGSFPWAVRWTLDCEGERVAQQRSVAAAENADRGLLHAAAAPAAAGSAPLRSIWWNQPRQAPEDTASLRPPRRRTTVYGNDDRRDWYELDSASADDALALHLLENAIMAHVKKTALGSPDSRGVYRVLDNYPDDNRLGQYYNLCEGERFLRHPRLARCSATLVGPSQVITAAWIPRMSATTPLTSSTIT